MSFDAVQSFMRSLNLPIYRSQISVEVHLQNTQKRHYPVHTSLMKGKVGSFTSL